jgi:transcriptional regulator with XRE-family HTH domain
LPIRGEKEDRVAFPATAKDASARMTDLGPLLRTQRQQAGLGLRTFAGLIGERASTVSAIESGRRAPWRCEETLARLVQVLGAPETPALWRETAPTNGHAPATNGAVQKVVTPQKLLWWWTNDEGSTLDRTTVAELAEFVGVEPNSLDCALSPREIAWPSLTELAIEWRVRQLLGRRCAQVTAAPVDVEAALENEAKVQLEIIPGLVPRFSVQACAVGAATGVTLYVDRIVADSRPLASYRYLLATCYAPAVLCGHAAGEFADAGWYRSLQQSAYWPQVLRDCQRFALATLLPAGPVLAAAQDAYQELVQQQGWVEVDVAARAVRNRLAEQFAVPPTLVHRRLVGWPCHVYGRIAQALAAEEPTLPPCDWWDHEKEHVVQRELFVRR